jgi:probable FeS assembly SUF system protein SufT
MAMERVELTRDCDAVQIPVGTGVTLEKGTEVYVMQSLGGSYTVQAPSYGGLFRIAGRDADAIGKEPEAAPEPTVAAESGDLDSQVWGVLKTCYDPEIPVNIVDLGLVYDMRITPEGDAKRVDVKMTLTAQGCGMGTSIATDARHKILALPGVGDATVDIVWDPPWTPQMISPEGRERLGMA